MESGSEEMKGDERRWKWIRGYGKWVRGDGKWVRGDERRCNEMKGDVKG